MSIDPRAGAAAAPVAIQRTKRFPAHLVVPAGVALAVGAIIAFTGREALTPATRVTVRPVVFAQETPRETGRDEPTAASAPRRNVRTVQAPGWLEPDPFLIACTALAEGVVAEMLVLEGETVEAGQVVARMVDDDARLELMRAEGNLATAEAELALARADLEAAQTDWEEPVERERAVAVTNAALAETIAELEQLPSLTEVKRSELAGKREELSRAERALERAAVSDIEVILLRAEVEAKSAEVESLERRGAILTARRDRLQAEAVAAERNFELRVAEKRMLDGARAGVARAQAQVDFARAHRDEAALQLERMTIRAPISGFVQRRLKQPGDKVRFGMDTEHSMHLIHLYDPEKLQVRVDVPLADASHVYVGQQCEVVVDVLPDETFRGEVTRITHEADLQKNTLEIKVRVINPRPILKPEMLTRVKFLGSSEAGEPRSETGREPEGGASRTVRVALECIEDSGGGAGAVWVVRDRSGDTGVVARRAVTIGGAPESGYAPVVGPLHAGDLLVEIGTPLVEGQRVRIREGGRGGVS